MRHLNRFLSPRLRLRTVSVGLLLLLNTPAQIHLWAQQPGTAAPAFDRPDLAGHKVTLTRLRGKVVLLNFWATWCAPCLSEMPEFSHWQRELGPRGLEVVGLAMDDEPAPVRRLVLQRQPAYPIVMGDAALASAYGGVLGLPVSVLIGRDGVVRRRYEGAADLNRMRQDILQALQ